MRSNQLSPELVTRFEKTHGERVNARWQQEPPKKEKNIQAYSPGPMEAVGGRVAAAVRPVHWSPYDRVRVVNADP